MTDEQITALVGRLKKAANSAPGRDPDKYGAWMTVTDFQAILAHIEAQAAEIARLRAVVERLEAAQHRGPVVTYKRGFGPGDGDGAALAQETQP